MNSRVIMTLTMLAFVSGSALHAIDSAAGQRNLIRFYKRVNDEGQERKLSMIRHADEPGCHDLSGFRKANRVMVVGYAWCTVYSETGCPDAARITPLWKHSRKDEFQDKASEGRMTRGTRWVLHQTDNIDIRSFHCEIAAQ